MDKGKIVLWFGNQPNQRALAAKLSEKFEITGIVIENRTRRFGAFGFKKIVSGILDRTIFKKIQTSWSGMLGFYQHRFPSWPDTEKLEVPTINSEDVGRFSQAKKPDLILVSGTSMVKGDLLKTTSKLGIMNLHTGLSPYVKGGPNCTNWCIANGEFHLIGNTVMWIDPGIDSGRIIASDIVEFDGSESLLQIHIKVMEAAHSLYINTAVEVLNSTTRITGTDQRSLTQGTTYYTRMWNTRKKLHLLKNMSLFRKEIKSGITKEKSKKNLLIRSFQKDEQ